MNDFILKCREWLLVLGYVETFKNENEVHFIKDQIRVCCIYNNKDSYCFLSKAILNKEFPLELKSGKYIIGTIKLNSLVNCINETLKRHFSKDGLIKY